MENMAWDGPKWGREDFFPTNPDLANILGRTDLDSEDFFLFFGPHTHTHSTQIKVSGWFVKKPYGDYVSA